MCGIERKALMPKSREIQKNLQWKYFERNRKNMFWDLENLGVPEKWSGIFRKCFDIPTNLPKNWTGSRFCLAGNYMGNNNIYRFSPLIYTRNSWFISLETLTFWSWISRPSRPNSKKYFLNIKGHHLNFL